MTRLNSRLRRIKKQSPGYSRVSSPVCGAGRERQLLGSPGSRGVGAPGASGASTASLSMVETVLLQPVFVERVAVLKVRARGLRISGGEVGRGVAGGRLGGPDSPGGAEIVPLCLLVQGSLAQVYPHLTCTTDLTVSSHSPQLTKELVGSKSVIVPHCYLQQS